MRCMSQLHGPDAHAGVGPVLLRGGARSLFRNNRLPLVEDESAPATELDCGGDGTTAAANSGEGGNSGGDGGGRRISCRLQHPSMLPEYDWLYRATPNWL